MPSTGVVGVEEEWAGLEKRIALRASFLAGELSAIVVELQGVRLAAIAARGMAVRQVEVCVEQHNRLKHLLELGGVSRSELLAVEAQLRAGEATWILPIWSYAYSTRNSRARRKNRRRPKCRCCDALSFHLANLATS